MTAADDVRAGEPLRVTVLGTGVMGLGMARSLLRAGLAVTVWNRNAVKAAPLGSEGARVAADLDSALEGADVVVTMLFDADTVADVVSDPITAGRWPSGAVWVQATTTGLEGTARLASLAADHDVPFVDAPVLGSKQPAQDGALTVLCSGPSSLRPRIEPVLEAVGSATVWVGEQAGQASGLKLVCNAWVTTLTDATAQSVALAEGLGLDPRLFLQAISHGGTNNAYVQHKGKLMVERSTATPAFSTSGARKDVGLIRQAMLGCGVDTRLTDAVLAHFDAAHDAGYAEHDTAAVIHAFRPPG